MYVCKYIRMCTPRERPYATSAVAAIPVAMAGSGERVAGTSRVDGGAMWAAPPCLRPRLTAVCASPVWYLLTDSDGQHLLCQIHQIIARCAHVCVASPAGRGGLRSRCAVRALRVSSQCRVESRRV